MDSKTTKNPLELTSSRVIARSALWNLAGQAIPLVFAVFTIPFLLGELGTASFGVLMLIWIVIGYFSLFDLGLGRTVTKFIAEKLGMEEEEEIPPLFWTSLLMMFLLGLAFGCIIFLVSPWVIDSVLKVPEDLKDETLMSFYLVALAIPLVVSTTGLRGTLEAQQRFGLSNAVRIPLGVSLFVGPALVLPFSRSLAALVASLLIIRIIAWAAYLAACLVSMPSLRRFSVRRRAVAPLLRYSGWIAVTNIVGPTMAYLDRFMVGFLLTVTAVAYYATPNEVVRALSIVPGAIAGVLFPAFSASFLTERKRTLKLYNEGLKYILVILFPISFLIVMFANEGLEVWLGDDFARNSFLVMQLLVVGRLIISLAQVPLALVQGVGRPDIVSKFQIVELPLFVLLLWLMIREYGIGGAAVALLLRNAVETVFLYAMAQRLLSRGLMASLPHILVFTAAMIIIFIPLFLDDLIFRIVYAAIVLALFSFVSRKYILNERSMAVFLSIFTRTPGNQVAISKVSDSGP